MSLIVGLTGQTGAGKTTACEVFANHGFGIINCDKVAREVCSIGSPCLNELVLEFSNKILNDDKSLNRKALGKIVFSDSTSLAKLNEITHPHILRKISKLIALLSEKYRIIIVDAPTLFESGANQICNLIVSVLASEDVTIPRIMERDLVDEASARNRLKSQHDPDFFKERSDLIVQNNGHIQEFSDDLSDLVKQIKEFANGNSN
ncbi:MAG: dephospho-CoA kinase [Oscillospiraceae bacterium]